MVSTTFVYMEYVIVDKAIQASDQGSWKQQRDLPSVVQMSRFAHPCVRYSTGFMTPRVSFHITTFSSSSVQNFANQLSCILIDEWDTTLPYICFGLNTHMSQATDTSPV